MEIQEANQDANSTLAFGVEKSDSDLFPTDMKFDLNKNTLITLPEEKILASWKFTATSMTMIEW